MISIKPEYHDICIVAKDRMIRLGDWKLSYQPLTDGGLYQLFNIREDPACRCNVIEQNPEMAQQLRVLLESWMEGDPKAGDIRQSRETSETSTYRRRTAAASAGARSFWRVH